MSRLNDPENFRGRVEAAAKRLADVPTRKLPEVARQTRARQKAGFDARFEQQRKAEGSTAPEAATNNPGSSS